MKVQKSKSDISKKSKKLKTFDWKDFMYDIRCKLWYAKHRIFYTRPRKHIVNSMTIKSIPKFRTGAWLFFTAEPAMGGDSNLDTSEENDQIVKLLGHFGKWQLILICPIAFFGIMSSWEVLVSFIK